MVSRLKALGLHLFGSVILASLSLCLVYLVWYPAPLANAVGVNDIFLMMLGIDVVLGPLLTFVVYKKGKKTLVMDLSIIVVIQLAALGYGIHAIAIARPAWLVYSVSRFDLVQANDLEVKYLDQAEATYRQAPWTGPRWVAAHLPSDVDKRNELVWGVIRHGADLPQRPDLYAPIEREGQAMAANARPIADLNSYNVADAVHKVRDQWPQADAFMPLITKGRPLTVLLKRGNPVPLAIVDLKAF